MAIESNPFGNTILTGEDAEKFLGQINDSTINEVAQETIKEGVILYNEFKEFGYVKLIRDENGKIVGRKK